MSRKRREIPWIESRDGTYYVFWYPAGATRSKRQSMGTKDRVEAQHRFAEFLSVGHARFENAEPGRPVGLTVAGALDDYWREHVATKVVDKARAEDAITHLKVWFKGDALASVDIPASRGYADARRSGLIGGGKRRKLAEGSDSTIRRELVVLQAAANHALRWKRIGAGEMPSIELPAEARGAEIWLTRAELACAITRATGRLRAFIEVAYYTGARRASVERLTRFQVDLAQNRINLTSPAEDQNQRRSKKRRPTVPIDAKLRPTVERLMIENAGSEWLFGDPRDMYRPFREHMAAIGLPEKSNPHILRHSRATHLLQDGASIYDVARLLGDTVATVERVYGHHSSDLLAAALTKGA